MFEDFSSFRSLRSFRDTVGCASSRPWIGWACALLHLVVTHSLCEPPLVEPGLVTPILWGKPPDLFMARGVLVCNASAQWTVHADVYDLDGNAVETEDWQAQIIVNGFDGQFKSREPPLGCPGMGHGHVHAIPGMRVGRHVALHCQADSVVSVASYIRSGQMIHRLFDILYKLPRTLFSFEWSHRGVNVGAGIDSYPCGSSDHLCNHDDPLELWMRSLAHHVLLVDGDMKRLQHALTKLREDSAASRFFALNKVATPVGVDAGELDDILVEAFDGAVDIIKIDIDSYDCAVLLSMLLRVEAVAIVLESQPLVPPPFKFARAFRSDDPLEHGLTGCSLSYQVRMLSPSYHLLVYSEQDTVFVHSKILSLLESLPPGTLFPWTRYPLRFPVDEFDCFLRSRFLHADAADRSLGKDQARGVNRLTPPPIPADFVREWLHSSRPVVTMDLLWGNITDTLSNGSTSPLANVRYLLDL